MADERFNAMNILLEEVSFLKQKGFDDKMACAECLSAFFRVRLQDAKYESTSELIEFIIDDLPQEDDESLQELQFFVDAFQVIPKSEMTIMCFKAFLKRNNSDRLRSLLSCDPACFPMLFRHLVDILESFDADDAQLMTLDACLDIFLEIIGTEILQSTVLSMFPGIATSRFSTLLIGALVQRNVFEGLQLENRAAYGAFLKKEDFDLVYPPQPVEQDISYTVFEVASLFLEAGLNICILVAFVKSQDPYLFPAFLARLMAIAVGASLLVNKNDASLLNRDVLFMEGILVVFSGASSLLLAISSAKFLKGLLIAIGALHILASLARLIEIKLNLKKRIFSLMANGLIHIITIIAIYVR